MYTEAYFAKIKKQTRIRVLLGLALIAVFLAGVIVFTVLRMQVPQLAVAGVGFIVVYFLWYFKISPWTRYNRFMKELRSGRTRTGVFTYEEIASETFRNIMQGDASIRPFKKGENAKACSSCDYRAVCGFDEKDPAFRYRKIKSMNKKEFFGK